MADNTTLNPGSGGDIIRTDDVGSSVKVPTSKIVLGADGADDGFVSATQPMPSNVTKIGGNAIVAGNGVTGTGSQRVTIASDNTPFAVKTDQTTHGTTDLVAADVTKIGGNAVSAGNGASGTGVQRVTIASDSTGVVGLNAGTNAIGTVGANSTSGNLLASTTVNTAGTVNATAVTGLGGYKQIMILLDVTAAATDADDTLDVYVDTSPDGGTTWVNAVHFNQVLGNGGAKQFWALLDPSGAAGTSTLVVSSDAAAGAVRPSMFTDRLRVRHVTVDPSGSNMSFTFAVKYFAKA